MLNIVIVFDVETWMNESSIRSASGAYLNHFDLEIFECCREDVSAYWMSEAYILP